MNTSCLIAWVLVAQSLLTSCQGTSATQGLVPTAVALETIAPSATPTRTPRPGPTETLPPSLTPTSIPTREASRICEDLLRYLEDLSFPEADIAGGLGPKPSHLQGVQSEGDERCWWSAYWSSASSSPNPPTWPDSLPALIAAFGPDTVPTRPSVACGAGVSVRFLEIRRDDFSCTHESGHGYPVPPDDPISSLSQRITCHHLTPAAPASPSR